MSGRKSGRGKKEEKTRPRVVSGFTVTKYGEEPIFEPYIPPSRQTSSSSKSKARSSADLASSSSSLPSSSMKRKSKGKRSATDRTMTFPEEASSSSSSMYPPAKRLKLEPQSPPTSLSLLSLPYSVPSATGRKRKVATLPMRERLPRAAKELPPLHYSETRRRAPRPKPTTAAQAILQLKDEAASDAFQAAAQSIAANRAKPSSRVKVEPPSDESISDDCCIVSWEIPERRRARRR